MAASASAPPPKHHILEYTYVADILEKRGPYRADHIAAAKQQVLTHDAHLQFQQSPLLWANMKYWIF